MSTLANITSLNLSLQTGGAALAVSAVRRVAQPARVVNVFGTADNVAPNFNTVSGAITYANSLTPIVTEPVVIRLFTKADGNPYDLTGLSSWTTYANQFIFIESDFVRLNETTTLPTTLPVGKQIWYIDPNGVETLWVGDASGNAEMLGAPLYEELASTPSTPAVESRILKTFKVPTGEYLTIGNPQGVGRPSVGYRSIFFGIRQSSETSAPRVTVYHNTFSAIISATRVGIGGYRINFGQPETDVNKIFFPSSPGAIMLYPYYSEGDGSTIPACYFKISPESTFSGGTSFNIFCMDGANDENQVDMWNVMGASIMYFHACIAEDIQIINP